jgi:hypothetical protein
MSVGDGTLQQVSSNKKICVACSIDTWEKARRLSEKKNIPSLYKSKTSLLLFSGARAAAATYAIYALNYFVQR